uniref:PHYHIP_C domain-containing protein n=1 Tax=Steinernema glaseri TaxID=37863 RepID=A0A1I7ZKJ0_9BILA
MIESDEEDDLILEFRESALLCTVIWSHTTIPPPEVEYAVEVRNAADEKIVSERGPFDDRCLDVRTKPGEIYHVKVACFEKKSRCRIQSAISTFRAIYSLEEMQMLYRRAVVCLCHARQYRRIEVLFRCKPAGYFREAVQEFGDTMVPYVKDGNGHKASPINGAINGLFFSARLNNYGNIPTVSPFGDTQFIINAELLLDPENVLYYFADFYCNSKSHYITIVICKPGSDANKFCSTHLPLLSKTQNPFVKIIRKPNGGHEFYIDQAVWVEIYYTETVSLNLGVLKAVRAKGLGTSQLGGLRHNERCEQCNLYL